MFIQTDRSINAWFYVKIRCSFYLGRQGVLNNPCLSVSNNFLIVVVGIKNQIKFIYFDVGGVAILDFSKTNKWNEMLSDLGVSQSVRTQFDELFDAHEKKICVGEPIEIFVNEVKSKFGLQFPQNYDMTSDFVDRFEKNVSMLNLFVRLKEDFKLGLLTGQYPNMLNMIFDKRLLPRNIWNVIIDSSVEGITKPDPKIYLLAEKKAGVKSESILFIDNKAKALEYPKSRGWQVFEYDPSNAEDSTQKLEDLIYG